MSWDAGFGDTHNDLRSSASLLSGVSIFPAEYLRLSLPPDSHADRQAVSEYKLIDYERLLSIEDLKHLRHVLLENKIFVAERSIRSVVPAEQKGP